MFVIWPKRGASGVRILEDLKRRFSVRDVLEVSWTESRFSRNMGRFYGMLLAAGAKVAHCGIGPSSLP